MTDPDLLVEKIRAAKRELREEYLKAHHKPWIIGFSGGKDSTLLAHLVVETLLAIPRDERRRRVYLVSNDTLVESPVFQSYAEKMLTEIADNIEALRIPLEVVRTHPVPDESFRVNMLGKGYPAPNRTFRWCTDRMKIRPTSRFIRELVSKTGEAILLPGTRRDESSAGAANIAKHDRKAEGALSPHADHKGVWVFTPVKDFTTEEVWLTLLSARRMLLDELLALQKQTGMALISPLEVRLVREQWEQDKLENDLRQIEGRWKIASTAKTVGNRRKNLDLAAV